MQAQMDREDAAEAVEFVMFQVSECYVYLIPPRKTAASYRADEWNVNKWAWEGVLKVISKGEECVIQLEEKTTGELYARAFLRSEEPHPVETVIDSSRYFVLRIEEEIGGRRRHAFIGIGFRERTEAYDFQAALHDHMKYLNKKKTAAEMEQHYQHTSSVDYSLKEGETIVLQLKNKSGRDPKSKLLEQNMSTLSLDEKGNGKEPVICLKPPPPPAATVSPASTIQKAALSFPTNFPDEKPEAGTRESSKGELKESVAQESRNKDESNESCAQENQSAEDAPDDDFGDFQTAG